MSASRYKYPRTPHLPWSPGADDDDVILEVVAAFAGLDVVVTEKMDGENTTMYRDHIHARSIDSRHHPSRNWVKSLHGNIAHQIPHGWRLCGENVYARHSVAYRGLESYFFLFSVWTDENECLGWDETVEWAALLGLVTPHEFYRGVWDAEIVESIELDTDVVEGFVVRTDGGFGYELFQDHIAKWVRKDHVQTDQHWMHAAIVPNLLREEE